MPTAQQHETRWEQALQQFPYPDLQSTSHVIGDFSLTEPDGYMEEFTFSAGTLLEEALEGGGWIEMRCDDGRITLTALFTVVRQGDWKNGSIFPEGTGVQCSYDFQTQTWACWIDSY